MKYIRIFLLIIAFSVSLLTIYATSVNLLIHNRNGEYQELEIGHGVSMAFNDSTLSVSVDSIPLTYDISDVAKLTYSVTTEVKGIACQPRAVFNASGVEFSLPGEHSVTVADLAGRIVLNERFKDTCHISHYLLPRGIVLIKVDDNETLKLMVR